jgi:hypothetical protein
MTPTALSLFDAARPSHTMGARSLPVLREIDLVARGGSLLREDLRPSILGEPAARRADAGATATATATSASMPHDRSLDGSRPTLDDVLLGAWEGLTSERREVACLVCGGTMSPRWGATSTPVGGRCGDCCSTLA